MDWQILSGGTMKISKKSYEYNRPSWYAINLATAFLNSGSLLASFISLINLFQDFINKINGIKTYKTFEEVYYE